MLLFLVIFQGNQIIFPRERVHYSVTIATPQTIALTKNFIGYFFRMGQVPVQRLARGNEIVNERPLETCKRFVNLDRFASVVVAVISHG